MAGGNNMCFTLLSEKTLKFYQVEAIKQRFPLA